MGLVDSLKAWYFGPPANTYLPPITRKSAGGVTGNYAGAYDVGPALRAGVLISGPGATEIYRDATGQSAATNSAVMACLNAIRVAYGEAPIRVYRTAPDGDAIVPDHPLAALLQRPNPHLAGKTLFGYVQDCKHTYGNAYVLKLRAGDAQTGNVVALWPLSPSNVTPYTAKGSGDFITAYRHTLPNGRHEDIDPANILHFRLGLDDRDHRVGLSPLRQLIREISSDREATAFADALLRNSAVAGGVVTTPADADVSPEDALTIKARLEEAFTGANRGRLAVITHGGLFKEFGFSPQELDLKALHRLPEERISAVLRVPAIIAGLGVGLDHATYSNVGQARQLFTETTMIPLWADDDEVLTNQLLPDFSADTALSVQHDLTDVRALQDDEDAKYRRLDLGVRGAWILPNEARADVGLPPIPGGDVPLVQQPSVSADHTPPAKSLALATKAAQLNALPEQLMAARERAAAEYEQALVTYFAGQRRRVRQKLEAAG